ncbi:MAG: ABC transporter ATP-binding protein [Candidatus Hydrogenedentes bacterium]|nr:ABC transporter ATP-binding protein [Candidatus Hydrogenedentota bacterium]
MAESTPGPPPCALTDAPRGREKPNAPPIVEFRGVTKVFAPGTKRAFTAIRDVTFRIEDLEHMGEFVALLGPSGCGKSTVLRLIAGLAPHHPATHGEVLLGGLPVPGPGPDRGMVFQDYTSFDNRTVLDNVAFGLECRGMPRRERYALANEWIAKVGLRPDQDGRKYPHQLSGGMRQRVAIARTLILKPRVILMDEPFGALDPATRHNMQDLLIQLWKEVEATVFFVTHDVNEAVYLGDRCYLFSNSPGTILHQFRIAPPDRPARPMMREKSFQDTVYHIREILDDLEEGRT